jgi:hypothetical protein
MNARNLPIRNRAGGVPAFTLFLLAFSLAGCRLPQETSLIRFIDILKRSGIVESPFLESEADLQSFQRTRPVLAEVGDKWPLLDLGLGENPFLLKKKALLGPAEQNILLAPPKSVYEFKVKIPGRGVLEFFYGVMREAGPSRLETDVQNVEFSVQLSSRGKNILLFSKPLSHPSEKVLVFNHKKIDLSAYAGRTVTLHFMTLGTRDALACWFNPVLYVPKAGPRNVVLLSLRAALAGREAG